MRYNNDPFMEETQDQNAVQATEDTAVAEPAESSAENRTGQPEGDEPMETDTEGESDEAEDSDESDEESE